MYQYDNGGNILSKTEYAYTTAADLSSLTPLDTITYTNGVVVEWVIHNVAYRTGQFFKVVGLEDIGEEFMSKGKTLDIGSTIYDDNHGFLSGMMWAFYAYVDPINAGRDALIEIFE